MDELFFILRKVLLLQAANLLFFANNFRPQAGSPFRGLGGLTQTQFSTKA